MREFYTGDYMILFMFLGGHSPLAGLETDP